MNCLSTGLALALAISLALLPPGAVHAEDELARFEGLWKRTARDSDDASRTHAIESATEALPFWMRGIARSVMLSSMVPPDHYTIRRTPDGLMIADGDAEPHPMLIDADAEVEGARLARRLPDGALEQPWRHGGDSDGTTFWSVSESRELLVRVVVRDVRLRANGVTDPIRYATRYSRVAPPAGSPPAR